MGVQVFPQVVARFDFNGLAGKDGLRVLEQYVIDALRLEGHSVRNPIEAINMKRGRLRHQYRAFLRKVCK